jgi:hypothetical protein
LRSNDLLEIGAAGVARISAAPVEEAVDELR